MEKYFAAAVPAEERLALINLASDLLARGYAGYQGVLAVHAEGSLEAEKMMVFRSYDSGPPRRTRASSPASTRRRRRPRSGRRSRAGRAPASSA